MTSSRHLVLSLFAAIALSAAASPRVARAQTEHTAGDIAQARELFQQAMEQREKGDLAGSLEKFKAAHALGGTPVTGVELGRTYLMAGKLVEAEEAFLSVARIPPMSQETARSTAARAEAADLGGKVRARIPSLTVKIVGAPPGSVAVTLDGEALPSAALSAPRLVNPGPHALVATSSGGGHAETQVTVQEGATVPATLSFTTAAPGAPAGASPAGEAAPAPESRSPPASEATGTAAPSYWTGRRIAGVTIAAAGVIGVAVGSAIGLSASSLYSQAEGETGTARVNDSASAASGGNAATIVFVAGAVVAAAGVVVWLTAPSAPAQVGTNGREVLLRVSF